MTSTQQAPDTTMSARSELSPPLNRSKNAETLPLPPPPPRAALRSSLSYPAGALGMGMADDDDDDDDDEAAAAALALPAAAAGGVRPAGRRPSAAPGCWGGVHTTPSAPAWRSARARVAQRVAPLAEHRPGGQRPKQDGENEPVAPKWPARQRPVQRAEVSPPAP